MTEQPINTVYNALVAEAIADLCHTCVMCNEGEAYNTFFSFSPHVNQVGISIYPAGWSSMAKGINESFYVGGHTIPLEDALKYIEAAKTWVLETFVNRIDVRAKQRNEQQEREIKKYHELKQKYGEQK